MEALMEYPSTVCHHMATFCFTISKKKLMKTDSNQHILQVYIKFVEKNLKILLEKEKENRHCGGFLIVKSSSVCHSASNSTTQSQTICKCRKCILHTFFPENVHCFQCFFFACFYMNVFMFIFKPKYESLSLRIW